MKKYILGKGLFLTSLLFGINASAMDGDNPPLFIQTKEVPSELRMYAQQDWQFYFENLNVTDAQTVYFPIIDRDSDIIHHLLEASLINNTPILTICLLIS